MPIQTTKILWIIYTKYRRREELQPKYGGLVKQMVCRYCFEGKKLTSNAIRVSQFHWFVELK
jgi:hypothetical protein